MDTLFEGAIDDVDRPSFSDAATNIYNILIPALGLLIIVLNSMVVISCGFILSKCQQSYCTYLFLGNVALSDFLTGIAVVFSYVFPPDYHSEASCLILIGSIVSATLVSVFSVGVIAVDRFIYILHGLKYQQYAHHTRAKVLILITWTIAVLIGFLPAMGWHYDTQNGRICWFTLLAPRSLILLTALFGLVPMLLVIILYSIILYKALKKVSELQKATSLHGTQSQSNNNLRLFRGRQKDVVIDTIKSTKSKDKKQTEPSKWKATKVVLFTTGSFFFTWIPWFIDSVMYVFCNPLDTPIYCNELKIIIESFLCLLGFANSLLNPIIYAWWHNGFRRSASKIYKKAISSYFCCSFSGTTQTTEISET